MIKGYGAGVVFCATLLLGGCSDADRNEAGSGVNNRPDTLTLYNRSCISCHGNGAAGAPRSHDVGAWAPRLAKGMDALIASTRFGVGAMPPRGMCVECKDEDFVGLIEYMATAPARAE